MPPAKLADQRRDVQTDRSFDKARYLPAMAVASPSCSDHEDDPSACPPENPVDPLRRVNVMLQFVGAGMLALGSTLVVSLYVTGPPRLNDMASSSTAVLLMTLLIGCLAVVPSWAAALLILIQKKPPKGHPPHNPRWLRFAALLAFFFAMLYVAAGLVLFVLLEEESSFVSFCMQNLPSTTPENCTERYNRAWVILLAVGVVFFSHIALGFPVYRYTRGPAFGVQLESGFLLEPGKAPPRRRRRSRFDSDSDSELEQYMRAEVVRSASRRSKMSTASRGSTRVWSLAKKQRRRDIRHGSKRDDSELSEVNGEPEGSTADDDGDDSEDSVASKRSCRRT